MDTRDRTNPFPGLRPFMQEEADLFFGRDRQSDELVRRLACRRFLAVVGASGSGKSSLVRAGLLPSLEGGFMAGAGAHWRIATLRPQDDPIGYLARAIVETGVLAHLDLAQPAAEGVVETTLRRSSLGLVEAARLARLAPQENLLILVDQFEELFRFGDLAKQRDAGDEAPAFVKLLLQAAQQTEEPVYVVITMRSDFLGDCDRFRGLPEAISDSQYLIPRLTRDELQEVITGPIGVRGGHIAPSLVQCLLNDVGDDMDQLPVLQHALMRAWDHWERDDPDIRFIDLNDLKEIGGMAEALSRHADEAFGSLATDRNRKIAERLFKCLTERGPDNREIRRPTPLSRIAAIANANPADVIRVIDVFRAPGCSFLMPPHGIALEGDSVIDISHESLIRQWGRLRTWVEEEAESRATYLRLVQAAQLRRAGKAGLWGEPDLTYARQWQEREAPNATWAERYASGFADAGAFLSDSEATHAADLEKERQQAVAERVAKERELEQAQALAEEQRQRAEEQARSAKRLRTGLIVAVSSAVFAVVALVVAMVLGWKAEQQAQIATSRNSRLLGAEALTYLNDKLDLALLLGVRASETPEPASFEARRALLSGLESANPGGREPSARLTAFLLGHSGAVESVAFSPNGEVLASSSRDRNAPIRLWKVATRQALGEPLTGYTIGGDQPVRSISFSPDGKTLASGSNEELLLWDVQSGRPQREPLTIQTHKIRATTTLAFSPDRKTLASGSEGKIILWDLATWQPRGGPLALLSGPVGRVAFSPDGRVLGAYWLSDTTIHLWDVETGQPHGQLSVDTQKIVHGLAFSPDSKTVAVAAGSPQDHSIWLWNIETGQKVGQLPPQNPQTQDGGLEIAFNHDGSILAAVTTAGTIQLWDVKSGGRLNTLTSHRGSKLVSVAFDRGGILVSGGEDGSISLWNISGQSLGEPLPLRWDTGDPAAFSPDGKYLASGCKDCTPSKIQLWNLATQKPLDIPLTGPTDNLVSLALSADAGIVAAGSCRKRDNSGCDGEINLWDVQNQKPLVGPTAPADLVSLALSRDGGILASGGCSKGDNPGSQCEQGEIHIWDVHNQKPLFHERITGHNGGVTSLAFSPNGKTLASAGNDIILWNVETAQQLGALTSDIATAPVEPPATRPQAVPRIPLVFTRDSKILASASGGNIFLWDAEKGHLFGRLPVPHLGQPALEVSSLAFSPDGKTLAAATDSTEVLATSPTGKRSSSLHLWDVPSQRPLGVHLSRQLISRIVFSSDSRILTWGGPNGTVRQWDIDVDSRRAACGIANRNLTHEEWGTYFEGQAYRKTCPNLPIDPGSLARGRQLAKERGNSTKLSLFFVIYKKSIRASIPWPKRTSMQHWGWTKRQRRSWWRMERNSRGTGRCQKPLLLSDKRNT